MSQAPSESTTEHAEGTGFIGSQERNVSRHGLPGRTRLPWPSWEDELPPSRRRLRLGGSLVLPSRDGADIPFLTVNRTPSLLVGEGWGGGSWPKAWLDRSPFAIQASCQPPSLTLPHEGLTARHFFLEPRKRLSSVLRSEPTKVEPEAGNKVFSAVLRPSAHKFKGRNRLPLGKSVGRSAHEGGGDQNPPPSQSLRGRGVVAGVTTQPGGCAGLANRIDGRP